MRPWIIAAIIVAIGAAIAVAVGIAAWHNTNGTEDPAPEPTTSSTKAACATQLDAAMARWDSQIKAYGYYAPAADQHGQGLIPECAGLTPADRADVYNEVGGKWGDLFQVGVYQGLNGQS
jgi:hypothetical protein